MDEHFYPPDLPCSNCGHENGGHGFYGCLNDECLDDLGKRCRRFVGVRQDDRDLSEPTSREEAGV
jgi:hypothetical protein